MTTKEEAIKRIGWTGDQHIAIAIWTEEDVLGRAQERRLFITQEQARKIIDRVDNSQDSSLGISWDTIDAITDFVLEAELSAQSYFSKTKKEGLNDKTNVS